MLRLLRALPLVATAAVAVWALSTNPLAAPFVARGADDLALTLERQVARKASTAWIHAALAGAVAQGDAERAAMLLDLARDLGRDVDGAAAQALLDAQSGMLATVTDCGACMIDVAACRSLAQIAACAAPFEMSPLGDLNALRRAGLDWAGGDPVDRLDAGLALVGLAATGALLATGGSSAAVKAGAGLLRMARRMGSVTPDLARLLRLPVSWNAVPRYLRGTARLEEVTDTAQLARIAAVAREMDAVRLATSTPEALRLMRLVDTPEDAARLARVAKAAGPRTTRTLAVLGKGRAFRATVRLTRAAAGTMAVLWLTAVQLAAMLGTRLGSAAWRALLPASGRAA